MSALRKLQFSFSEDRRELGPEVQRSKGPKGKGSLRQNKNEEQFFSMSISLSGLLPLALWPSEALALLHYLCPL
jgi:hypothetical protein